MAAATLADINSTLKSIKRDTALTAKRLSGKGTSAEEAREGLKERTQARDIIAKPTAPKAPSKNKGGGIGGFFSGLLAKGIDWLKWFAAIGLGAFFFKEIGDFIKAAFEPWKKAILKWWDEKKVDIGKAWEGVLDATGFNKLMEGSEKLWNDNILPFFEWFYPENNKFIKWFANKGDVLDKWLEDSFLGDEWKSMKNFLLGEKIHGEFGEEGRKGGLLSGAKTYAENIKISLGKFGEALGLIDADGNITGLGVLAGAGGLATLFTFLGPGKLLKAVGELGFWGVKTLGGLFIKLVGGLGKLVLWTGPKMLGQSALWIGEKGLKGGLGLLTGGFTKLSNLVGVKGAFGTALNAAAIKLTDWKDGFGKGGLKKGLKAAFTKGSPLLTGLTSMLPALVAALALAGIVALVIAGIQKWGELQRQKQAKADQALKGAAELGENLDDTTTVISSAAAANIEKNVPEFDMTAVAGKTHGQIKTAVNRAVLNKQITPEQADLLRGEVKLDKKQQGGTGKRMFFDMQSEVINRAARLVRAGVLYHKDGQEFATKALNKIREWVKDQGTDPKPITKAVLAKFGLMIAKPGEMKGNKGAQMALARGVGPEVMKAMMAGTYDFESAIEKFGGLTGLYASSEGLNQFGKLSSTVQSTRAENIADGTSQADRGKQYVNQATASQVFKQLQINTDKADLIAAQARKAFEGAQHHSGARGDPGAPPVIYNDNSSKVSNAATTVIPAVKQLWWQRNMPEWLQ